MVMAEASSTTGIISARGESRAALICIPRWRSTANHPWLAICVVAALAPGNLELCAEWRAARGVEKATLANRLGATNSLTKNTKLAEAQPGDSNSLYRSTDIQRLCRNS